MASAPIGASFKQRRAVALPTTADCKTPIRGCGGSGLASRRSRIARAGELRFEDYDLALSAAEAGLGVALARAPLAADALRAGRLVRLPGPAFSNPKSMYVVTRPGETRREVRLFVDRMTRLAGTGSA